jgi:AraC-like DNA-binding protein
MSKELNLPIFQSTSIATLQGLVPNRCDTDSFLGKVAIILEKKFNTESFSINELCEELCLCPMQVHRKVKYLTGYSPGRLLLHYRLYKALILLHTTDLPIGEIAWQTGFSSQNYFTRAFRKELGLTPSEARTMSRLELC